MVKTFAAFSDVFDDFDWIRNCGPTPSETTGPENDHTRGNFIQDVPHAACSGRWDGWLEMDGLPIHYGWVTHPFWMDHSSIIDGSLMHYGWIIYAP